MAKCFTKSNAIWSAQYK